MENITSSVSNLFVKVYYGMQSQKPSEVYRFYNDESSYIRGEVYKNGKPEETITGKENIKRKIESVGLEDCKTIIRQVEALQTLGKSITLQVIGVTSVNKAPYRPFVQTFVLTPKENEDLTFYIHNDIFRYQDNIFVDESADRGEPVSEEPLDDAATQQDDSTEDKQETTTNEGNDEATNRESNNELSDSTSLLTVDSIHDSTSEHSNETRRETTSDESTSDETTSDESGGDSTSHNDTASDTTSFRTNNESANDEPGSDGSANYESADTRRYSSSDRDSEHSSPSDAIVPSNQAKDSTKSTPNKDNTKVSWADIIKNEKSPNTTTAYISARNQVKPSSSTNEIKPTNQQPTRSNETNKYEQNWRTNKFDMSRNKSPTRNTNETRKSWRTNNRKPSYQNNQQIYVSRIKQYFTNDDLWRYFEEYGVVIDIIRFGANNLSFNSALVVFEDPRVVDDIIGQNQMKRFWLNDNDDIEIRRKREKGNNLNYNNKRSDYHRGENFASRSDSRNWRQKQPIN